MDALTVEMLLGRPGANKRYWDAQLAMHADCNLEVNPNDALHNYVGTDPDGYGYYDALDKLYPEVAVSDCFNYCTCGWCDDA